jgi:putative ABC transport system permease protein
LTHNGACPNTGNNDRNDFAGAEPETAVKYQIFIVFTLLVVAAISSIIVCILNYRTFYKPKLMKPAYQNKLSM